MYFFLYIPAAIIDKMNIEVGEKAVMILNKFFKLKGRTIGWYMVNDTKPINSHKRTTRRIEKNQSNKHVRH